ncbi:MAG: transketolase [Deltaproteobacteria bacterium]|nr:transketolase [Deltaproteobacteria bacterium]
MWDAALLGRLEETARTLRLDVVKMLHQAGSGHTGGSLSAMDILTALFFHHLKTDPAGRAAPDRDRFVLSKGHAAPAYYAVLARLGCFPASELGRLRQLGSCLQGHPDCRMTPGVEVSTGSLGQGLSVGLGMALGLRLDHPTARVYVLLGDGEIQEGMIWEAAMAAAHFQTGNLTAIADNNGLQIDGHDQAQILDGLDWSCGFGQQPSVLIAKTIKGKGVSCFEGKVQYHGVSPNDEELKTCLLELGEGGGS